MHAPAVTAGGMLISRRRGRVMRAGKSTVSSLVRKACRRGWQQGGRGEDKVGVRV